MIIAVADFVTAVLGKVISALTVIVPAVHVPIVTELTPIAIVGISQKKIEVTSTHAQMLREK
jgi:hypothetical protein